MGTVNSQPVEPTSEMAPALAARERANRWMRVKGWPAAILFGLLTMFGVLSMTFFIAMILWPLPTLAECTLVSGRIREAYSDSAGTARYTRERLHVRFEGNERYFSYQETDPSYLEVKSQLRILTNARIWFKSPPTFIFPLYSTELWRIEVDDRTVVDYDTIAADAGRKKIGIALTGLVFFGLLTFATLRSNLRAARAWKIAN